MVINGNYTLEYSAQAGIIAKLISQYFGSGELRDRFSAFDKTAVEYGKGFEIDIALAAKKYQGAGGAKADEHGTFPAKIMSLTFNKFTGGQYAVTVENERLRECVGNDAKKQEYAAELARTLMQGWTRDKNRAVAEACAEIIKKSTLSGATVTLGADSDAWAVDMLTAVKTWVENFREGVTGASYGNEFVDDDEIAVCDVAVVMSNATAAALDSHGFAKVFTPEYLEAANITRITSNKIADNTILVTDARNVQVREKFDLVTEPFNNSDGTYNIFYNKSQYVEPAIGKVNGAGADCVAFPFIVITTTEADAGA